jgi:hypothetical protein
MAEPEERPQLTVEVSDRPDPHRIRAAIEAALAGRVAGAGPEAEIGRAVAAELAGGWS